MALDFDPAVVALSSQPFRLTWTDGKRERGHTPDYFVRLRDGTGVVVDVRLEDLVDEDTAEVFAFTARVCEEVGWQFRHVGDLRQPYRVNLRWLSRYRHGRCYHAPSADRLREVFAEPLPLLAGAEHVGDRLAVLPVLYHLLWQQTARPGGRPRPVVAAAPGRTPHRPAPRRPGRGPAQARVRPGLPIAGATRAGEGG